MDMTAREPWLLVQEGGKLCLLAQDHQAYYLITVNKKLTAEKEGQLSRCAGITGHRLEEMGLSFRSLPKSGIRGVALTGSEAGETLYFYPVSGKKQKFVFSDDYDPARTDAFFSGMERFTPPGKKVKKNDPEAWRAERQDPALYKKLEAVPMVLTALTIGCGVGYLCFRSWPWYLAGLVGPVTAVALEITMPAYFTMIVEKGSRKKALDLTWTMLAHALIVLLSSATLGWMNDALIGILWGVCGLAAVLVMLLAEEFRRRKGYLFFVFILAGLILTYDVDNINRVFDFSEPERYSLTVEDLERNDDSYKCVVTLPDGRAARIRVSRTAYNDLELGGDVQVELSTGALGIEYIKAYPAEEA